ncbi:aldo/keto reductase [Sinorhizobium numidicum]|uniref:Aldo/keto reductase n=1 Tax=Sinorhizobium numidicum TaxID=680248 RepID=A0ABY8CZT9_9HYPH|nr:aldo/keto reductase [Sinorhizobium numidicum]WEX76224.1 aldo/keto reductase [Sinorhizobium numidicum]WEX82883.1 aldo/keto reductase [Sinorhizobium numidicum]
MHYRTLGRTGLQISEIGYGAWGIGNSGWRGANDDESVRALNRAIDLGLNFIDTALGYGDGHSERLVGKLLRERSETIYVATKIPPKNRLWPARRGTPVEEGFPADHVIASTETSLRNLGVETIDVQQFHVWSDEWVGVGDWQPAIERLKRDGKIRFFGVSINDYEPDNALQLIETGVVDSVQVIYNIFEQSPEERLFPACLHHNIGVIARVPLDEGGLTGQIRADSVFPEGDFRANYFRGERKREVEERVRAIVADLDIAPEALAETALRFVLSHPAVSTVIPGMRSVRNVERNCTIGGGRGLGDQKLAALRAHRWPRNFYRD